MIEHVLMLIILELMVFLFILIYINMRIAAKNAYLRRKLKNYEETTNWSHHSLTIGNTDINNPPPINWGASDKKLIKWQ